MKHYDAGLIEDVVDGVIGEDDLDTEDYPCAGTMRHWKWWLGANEKNIEGQVRASSCHFLGFDEKFLKYKGSFLQELRQRLSPGWLGALQHFLHNSGGRLEPYPQG